MHNDASMIIHLGGATVGKRKGLPLFDLLLELSDTGSVSLDLLELLVARLAGGSSVTSTLDGHSVIGIDDNGWQCFLALANAGDGAGTDR